MRVATTNETMRHTNLKGVLESELKSYYVLSSVAKSLRGVGGGNC